jgi:hypothetical protein
MEPLRSAAFARNARPLQYLSGAEVAEKAAENAEQTPASDPLASAAKFNS